MTALSALLSRVENASGPDRSLFIDAMRLLGINAEWREDNGKAANDDALLWERIVDLVGDDAFLDATIALAERVLPGWSWCVAGEDVEHAPNATLTAPDWQSEEAAEAATPALALLAAIIKAKMETENDRN